MSIAERIIKKCGGPRAVAEMLNVKEPTVYRWTYPKSRGGTDGLVPSRYQSRLLRSARLKGISLSPEDFFDLDAAEPGAEAA
jgi:hypothetical protein